MMMMGLIGYTTDEVRRRSKEIAIRKVNGAEASGILEMLVKDVFYVAVAAVVIGVAAYAIVAAIEYRRIRKVPMDEALKNVE